MQRPATACGDAAGTNERAPVNPASLLKLATTAAALDLLGPASTWATPVWLAGPLRDGVLDGPLVIKGNGDPKLVLERVWLLLRRVRALGVSEIRGDIVLDRSAFTIPATSPADFDGEPLRPYNVHPDALLLNYKSLVLTFAPDAARGIASVAAEPPLAGVAVDASVPLLPIETACGDWRGALKADFADPSRLRFAGAYPVACGERVWPIAYADPASYNARIIEALWRELGGRLGGRRARRHVAGGLEAELRGRLAAAGRSGARHQQVQQQRDGAAAVPHARPGAARQRHAGGGARRAEPLARRALRQRRRRRRHRQRLRAVARHAHERHAVGTAAAMDLGLAGDARSGRLAAGRAASTARCAARRRRLAAHI